MVVSPPSSKISSLMDVSACVCDGGVIIRFECMERVGLCGEEKVPGLKLDLCKDIKKASSWVPEDVVRIDVMSTLCFLDNMRGMKTRLRGLLDEAAGTSFADFRLVARRKRPATPKETEALLRVLAGGAGVCFGMERPRPAEKVTCGGLAATDTWRECLSKTS